MAGAILTVTEGEIATTFDGTPAQEKWEMLSPEQRTKITEWVYDELVSSDVIWAEYHRALDVAMDAVPTPTEPWCAHDPAAVVNGICECGLPVGERTAPVLDWEEDRWDNGPGRVDFTVGGV